MHIVLAPLNQKKIDKSGRNHRALPAARWLIKEVMDRSLTSRKSLPTPGNEAKTKGELAGARGWSGMGVE